MTRHTFRLPHLLAFVALAGLTAGDLSAQRGGRGGGGARAHHSGGRTQHASARTTHRGTSQHATNRSGPHRNVQASNVSRNGNRVNNGNNTGDVNVNVNGRYGYRYGAPVARGVVAGATTAAIMGHYYNTLPAGCVTVNNGGLIYHHCGTTWYRTEGTRYVVVEQP